LTLAIYKVTRGFPVDEKFGLISQMRRSASSIAANIAEGCGRNGDAELARYLQIAMGSASELEYHILLAHDLNIIETTLNEKLTDEVIEVKKMIASFIKKLRAN
jgi:four helix bundle protein